MNLMINDISTDLDTTVQGVQSPQHLKSHSRASAPPKSVDEAVDLANLGGVLPLRRRTLGVRLHHRRVGDVELAAQVLHHHPRHIQWIGRKVPKNRTIVSCNAKPSRFGGILNHGREIVIRLNWWTYSPILRQADLLTIAVPWWGGRQLRFEYP
jgi:hypothetical protein